MDSRRACVYPRTSPRCFLSCRSVLFRGPPCEHASDESQRPTEAPPAAAGSTRPWSPRVPRRRRVSNPSGASTGVTFQSHLDGLGPCGIQSTYSLTISFSLESPSAPRPTRAKDTSLRNESANSPASFFFNLAGSRTWSLERSPGSTFRSPPA